MDRDERRTWDKLADRITHRTKRWLEIVGPSFADGSGRLPLDEKLVHLHRVAVLLQNTPALSSLIPDSHHGTIELEQVRDGGLGRRIVIGVANDRSFYLRHNQIQETTFRETFQTPEEVVRFVQTLCPE